MENLYLDDNATKKFSPSVEKYVREDFINDYANASSEHDAGFELSNKIKLSRQIIADHIGSSTKKIIFTSGATESINTILSVDNLQRLNIKTIISSPMVHHATLHQLEYLSSKGIEVHLIRNDENGVLDYDHLNELASKYPKSFFSFLFVNNETGVINDVARIVSIAKNHHCIVHIDAVQVLGKIQFDLDELDCDYASFSGHKIGSFKGVGLLYAKDIEKFLPLLHGGGQERGYRPGTYNYPAIRSLALAIQDIDLNSLNQCEKNRNLFESEFKKLNSIFKVNCEIAPRVSNTSNLYFGGMDCRELLLKLSRQGFYVSTGSACNGANPEPSHVLKSIRNVDGVDSLRISTMFTEEKVNLLLKALKSALS